jgi:hypothetical protein
VDDQTRSAGDHEWRDIHVKIFPFGDHASASISVRRHRGAALVWERHLGTYGLRSFEEDAIESVSGVLLLAAQHLLAISVKAE